MSNKQTNSKLWRVLGIAVIGLVILAGFVVGAYSMGLRSGSSVDGTGFGMHPYGQFQNNDDTPGSPSNSYHDGYYDMPMHGRGGMFPAMGFFFFGRILGGLFFLGLIFAVLRMIFFPHWRRSNLPGHFSPHHPHFHQEECCCKHHPSESEAEMPDVAEEQEN